MKTFRRPRVLWRASLQRTLFEAALLGGAYVLSLLLLQADIGPQHVRQGLWFLTPGWALLCALRLRLPQGSRRQKLLFEGVAALLLSALATTLLLLVMQRSTPAFQEVGRPFPEWHDWFIMVLSGVILVGLRVGVRLWLFWDRLRHQRLVWALTHAHLTLALLAALPIVVLLITAVASQNPVSSAVTAPNSAVGSIADRVITSILPALVVYSGLTVIGLGVVLPPFAVVSFLVARRTTRRLKALVEATSALSAGNYSTRVDVAGEDEVARLQADFNAMAAQLERTLRELETERDTVAGLLQSRRELIASVSHELRTPVATLQGYLESTLERWDQSPPTALRHDLEVMQRETERLGGLIDDLFTLARVEAGRLTLQPRPTNIESIVERLLDSIAPLVWQSGRVRVVADLPPDLPTVLADEGRLEQVLGNLIHNGVRHTQPGGIVAVMAAAESEHLGDPTVRVEVRDTGEGIAPEDLPHIWERFYRGKGSRNRDRAGAGLGLALVKELTEAMGGSVAVESSVGEGSRFTIHLLQA